MANPTETPRPYGTLQDPALKATLQRLRQTLHGPLICRVSMHSLQDRGNRRVCQPL